MAVCSGLLNFISNYNDSGLFAVPLIVWWIGFVYGVFYARLCILMGKGFMT